MTVNREQILSNRNLGSNFLYKIRVPEWHIKVRPAVTFHIENHNTSNCFHSNETSKYSASYFADQYRAEVYLTGFLFSGQSVMAILIKWPRELNIPRTLFTNQFRNQCESISSTENTDWLANWINNGLNELPFIL